MKRNLFLDGGGNTPKAGRTVEYEYVQTEPLIAEGYGLSDQEAKAEMLKAARRIKKDQAKKKLMDIYSRVQNGEYEDADLSAYPEDTREKIKELYLRESLASDLDKVLESGEVDYNNHVPDGLIYDVNEYNEPYYIDPRTGKYYYAHTRIKSSGGRIRKAYQQGGSVDDETQQQLIALYQAYKNGDKNAAEQIEAIVQAAQNGDQQATAYINILQQIAEQYEGAARSQAIGGKIEYIRKLRNNTSDNVTYERRGGRIIRKIKK